MKISMEDIECFLVAAEQASFTRAAALLYQTQPTVSRHIANLERELGAHLFDRAGKTPCLTPEGEVAYKSLAEVKASLSNLRGSIGKGESARSALKIGCYGVYDYQVIADINAGMRQKHPNIDISYFVMEPGNAVQELMAGNMDLVMGVRCELEKVGNIRIEKLLSQRLVAIVHPDNPLAKQKSVKMEDLKDVELVLWKRESAPVTYDTLIQTCKNLGGVPKIWGSIHHRQEMPLALVKNENVSILPEGCHSLAQNMGVVVPIDDLDICMDYCLAYRKDSSTAVIQRYWDEALALRKQKKWKLG